MVIYTEEQLQAVAAVVQAMLRAPLRHAQRDAEILKNFARVELRRLGEEFGQDTMEAIARELDARAATGDMSTPATTP